MWNSKTRGAGKKKKQKKKKPKNKKQKTKNKKQKTKNKMHHPHVSSDFRFENKVSLMVCAILSKLANLFVVAIFVLVIYLSLSNETKPNK